MGAAFGRRHHVLGRIGEQQRSHPVVVPRGGQGQHGRDLDRESRLAVRPAEMERSRLIHDEEQRQLALLHEGFDERMAHPRGHVPVDGAEVVALLVRADLGELDSLAAEDRPVLAREQRVHQVARAQLDPFDLLEHLASDGATAHVHWRSWGAPAVWSLVLHGTRTASRMRPIT